MLMQSWRVQESGLRKLTEVVLKDKLVKEAQVWGPQIPGERLRSWP